MADRIQCPNCQHHFTTDAGSPSPQPTDAPRTADASSGTPSPPATSGARTSGGQPQLYDRSLSNPTLSEPRPGDAAFSIAPDAQRADAQQIRRARDRRWTLRGWLLRLACAALPLAAFAAWYGVPGLRHWATAKPPAADERPQAVTASERSESAATATPSSAASNSASPKDPIGPKAPASPANAASNPATALAAGQRGAGSEPWARLPDLAESLVRLETRSPTGHRRLGTGFVWSGRGEIATNFHVLAEATAATARFADGVSYEVAGYRAVAPEWDLAIVQLRAPPPNLTPLLPGADELPVPLTPVIAIGHPLGAEFSPTDGRVSRCWTGATLPAELARPLAEVLPASRELDWIQHTAPIAPGNSGGPLLDREGRVIGINTWVDGRTRLGFALHVRHLQALAAATGDPATPLQPLSKYTRQSTRARSLLATLSPARMRQLWEDARAIRWHPASEEDYERLSQLALAVTVAHLPGALLEGAEFRAQWQELRAVAEQVTRDLKTQTWAGPGQLTLINELAARRAGKPLAGLLFVAQVLRKVEGDQGERGLLLEIDGTRQVVYLPAEDLLTLPPAGTHCLVLGVNLNGNVVRYGENPLKLTVAPVIASRTLLPLGQ